MLPSEGIEREERRRGTSVKPLLIYLILFFVVWSLRATVFFPLDRKLGSPLTKTIYANALKFIVWVIPVFVYLRVVGERRPLEYLKLTTRASRRGLAHAAAASVIFFVGIVLFEQFTSGRRLHTSPLPATAILSSLISSALEEILFRGFVLRELWRRMSFARANLLAAALFTLVHWPHWLWAGGFNSGLVAGSVSILILGVFLGYLLKWTNSLWPSIVAHIVNNVLALLLRV